MNEHHFVNSCMTSTNNNKRESENCVTELGGVLQTKFATWLTPLK